MLRRVEPTSVTVFVALSHPRDVTVAVHPSVEPTSTPVATGMLATRAVGLHLHVAAVTVDLQASSQLQENHVYGYSLSLARTDANDPHPQTVTLGTANLLSAPDPLGYEAGKLPSFALPPTALTELRLVHASCRLPSAEGPDALPALDGMILLSRTQPSGASARPHQLFLTGDQIYADDVAPSLLWLAQGIGAQARGWQEKVPGPDGAVLDLGTVALGPTNRSKTLDRAGFTSEEQGSHLISLAEFFGMYLLVWSDALWQFDANGAPVLPDEQTVFPSPAWQNPLRRIATRQLLAKQPLVASFASNVSQVRRALANVPTYMSFDDHEVSDDWYIDERWKTTVESNPLGNRVLVNALAAYAVFQAWGNEPTRFETGAGKQLLDELEKWMGDASLQGDVLTKIRGSLGLPAVGTEQTPPTTPPRLLWDYEITFPTNYRVIVLDSRTHRAYPTSNDKIAPAALIASSDLGRQISDRIAASSKALTIVVASAPIVGLRWLEETLQVEYAKREGRDALVERDVEPWSGHLATFHAVVRELSKATRVVVLSGDVHYGFTATLDYWDETDKTQSRTARLVQLTSSGLKNETWKLRGLGNGSAATYLGAWWTGRASPYETDASYVGWLAGGTNVQLNGSGVTLPAGFLFEVPAERWVGTLTQAAFSGQEPDWRYRIRFRKDERADDQRVPAGVVVKPVLPVAAWTGLADLAAAHVQRHRYSQMRLIVGHNNLGEVTFPSWTAAVKTVRHSLWFAFDPKASTEADPATVMEASLEPQPSVATATQPKPDLTHP